MERLHGSIVKSVWFHRFRSFKNKPNFSQRHECNICKEAKGDIKFKLVLFNWEDFRGLIGQRCHNSLSLWHWRKSLRILWFRERSNWLKRVWRETHRVCWTSPTHCLHAGSKYLKVKLWSWSSQNFNSYF